MAANTLVPPASQEGEDTMVLVGVYQTKVVGIQYYDGEVNKNEMVLLEREPTNPYDRWAVRIDNVRNGKVGHMARTVVCHLAPLMDNGTLELDGVVPFGNKNVYSMPLHLYAYAEPQNAARVQSAMMRAQCKQVQGAIPTGFGGAFLSPGGAGTSRAASQGLRLNSKKAAESIDKLFQELSKQDTHRETCDPSPEITAPLYPHQQEALAWMIKRENCNSLPPFWEPQLSQATGNLTFVHALTNFISTARPKPLRGGILADDMGLGKTLELIALIATNGPGAAHPTITVSEIDDGEGEEGDSHQTKKQKKEPKTKAAQRAAEAAQLAAASEAPPTPPAADGPKGTLIICPLSVLPGWQMQLEEHTAGGLSVYVYHGSGRDKRVNFLREFDVVLTSYSTLASEGGSKNGITKVPWLRVIADEAHYLKNASAQTSKIVRGLTTERVWAVTGTPIQNSLRDLHGLLAFLRLEPLNDAAIFKRAVERPVKEGEPGAVQRLQALVGSITLRRTKDMRRNGRKLVELPPKTVEIVTVELEREARTKYERWEEAGRHIIQGHIATNTLLQNYTGILEIILRLRQICCDPSLVPGEDPVFSMSTGPSAELTQEVTAQLVALLKMADQEECPVCLNAMANPCATLCRHIFCRPCIEMVIQRDKPSCPLCRSDISLNALVEMPEEPLTQLTQLGGDGDDGSTGLLGEPAGGAQFSAKIKALLANISAQTATNPNQPPRHVVFSQFTSYLDLVQHALKAEGISHCRLDGRTSRIKRAEILKSFASNAAFTGADEAPLVMLVSLKAGGVGLNLTAASNVHHLDPWWNPSVEAQAQDRVHRLGQRRPVNVYRYLVEDSIETRMLELQEVKRELMRAAFERSNEEVRNRRIEDVRLLMQL